MKLFVIGNSSPNPKDWSEWNEVVFIIAENEKQAQKIAEDNYSPICEIPMDKAMVLYKAPSPELWYGEDA